MTSTNDNNVPSLVDSPTSEDLIKARLEGDSDGNTVLHLAVQYNSRNIASQLEMVKKVFEWCPQALEQINNAGHSPYRHCIQTYEKPLSDSKKEGKSTPSQYHEISSFLKDKIMHLADRDLILRLLHSDKGAKPGEGKICREELNRTTHH